MSPVPDHVRLGLDGERYVAALGLDCSVASDVVLVYDLALAPARPLSRRLLERRRPSGHPFRAVDSIGDGIDIVVANGPGSAVAAVTVELLAVFGARRVISVGVAAGDHRTGAGSVLVLGDAPDPLGLFPCPSGEPEPRGGSVFDRLATDADGVASAHTTLWPFQVDAAAIARVPDSAPTIIEMEARALFAVGDLVDLDVQALVAVSDRYDEDGRWELGDPDSTGAGLDRALALAVDALLTTRTTNTAAGERNQRGPR